MNVIDIVNEARALMPMRRRGANGELYNALVLAMRASEICLADPHQSDILADVIAQMPRGGKNRQFVEKGSDAFQRVCRYVFLGEEHTANINRYAHALREANREGVTSDQLPDRLASGGVNQFYLKRPLPNVNISTKCIRLNHAITHRKAATFTLTLRRAADNSYQVLAFE